jgi:dihydroxyacetone kinase-like predicted kinase
MLKKKKKNKIIDIYGISDKNYIKKINKINSNIVYVLIEHAKIDLKLLKKRKISLIDEYRTTKKKKKELKIEEILSIIDKKIIKKRNKIEKWKVFLNN